MSTGRLKEPLAPQLQKSAFSITFAYVDSHSYPQPRKAKASLPVPAIYHRESMDASQTPLPHSMFANAFANSSDYGDPSIPEDFDFMYPISPLHNVDTGKKVLPPMLLLTADREYLCFHGIPSSG